MEFFVDHWIWFLGAGIFILMTLIGYLAEKTDFGRKDIPAKPKKKEEPKIEIETENEIENEPEVQMSLATDTILEEPKEEIENLESFSATEEVPEELLVPFGDTNTNIESDFEEEEPQMNVEEVVEEEQPEELQVEDVATPNIELPDLETIVSEEDDEDDVWKF